MPRTTDGDGTPVPQRLLAAATRLFAEQGYDRTSVQEIVEAAGVTKGALYHYFGSKDDLLHEVYARVLRVQQERLDALAGTDEPIGKRLRAAAADVVVTTIERGGFGAETAAPAARLILSEWFHLKDRDFVAGSSQTR